MSQLEAVRDLGDNYCLRYFMGEITEQMMNDMISSYKLAFAGPPWYEVSKCSGCSSGFSSSGAGESCTKCGTQVTEEAYPDAEIDEKFKVLMGAGAVVCAVYYNKEPSVFSAALPQTAKKLVSRKYGNVDLDVQNQLLGVLPKGTFGWVEETFAGYRPDGTRVTPEGALRFRKEMIQAICQLLLN